MMNHLFRISLVVFCCAPYVFGQASEKDKHPYELMICDYVKLQL